MASMFLVFCAVMEAYDDSYHLIPIPKETVTALAGRKNIDPQAELTQYLVDEPEKSPIKNAPILRGQLSIEKHLDGLKMCATYALQAPLNKRQKFALKKYTEGQFSDGAGEVWTQELWEEVHISLDVS